MAFKSSLALHLCGTTISVSPGWLAAIVVVLGFTLYRLAPDNLTSTGQLTWLAAGALLFLAMFASLLLHEAAHAWMSRVLKRPKGKVRLYPFGGVGEGFEDPGSPRHEAIIALAGPVANLLIAILFATLYLFLSLQNTGVARWFGYLALGNGALAVGNMLPGYPLDGGRLFRALVWYLHDSFDIGTRAAVIYGQLISLAALAGGAMIMSTRSNWATWGTWIVVIGWAMNHRGRQELTRGILIGAGSQLPAREVAIGLNPRVKADQTLDEVLEALLAEFDSGIALVTRERQVIGVIRPEDIRRFARADWATRNAEDAMLPAECLVHVDAAMPVRELLQMAHEQDGSVILVTSGEDVLGAIDRRTAGQRIAARMRDASAPARA